MAALKGAGYIFMSIIAQNRPKLIKADNGVLNGGEKTE